MLPDTRFPVELHQTVRASHAKVGDAIEFRTLEPTLIGNGVVVPENAKLLGEIVFIRSVSNATPPSWIRIVVNGLHWRNGQATLNAVVDGVYYVRSAYFDSQHRGPRSTFLEGVHISPHLFRNASTDFFSDSKEVVLRRGILLQLRQIAPKGDQIDESDQTLSASSKPGKE